MNNILAVLVYLSLGFFLSRLEKFPKSTSEVLNLMVIYVALPALILEKFPSIPLDSSILVPAITPWVMLVLSIIFVWLFSRAFKLDRPTTGCLYLLIPLGNTSFLGFPMIEALLGEEAVSYAIIYDQVGSFIALSTYGTAIVALYSQTEESFNLKKVLRKIALFPPFISLVLAITLRFTAAPPESVQRVFEILGSMLVPLAMISVGFQFKGSFEKKHLPTISMALGFKMLVAPVVLFALFKLIGKSGLPVSTSILESGMPPMITAGAVAMSMNLAPKLAAALVGLGILFSFISLPLLKFTLGL
ncbi:MAG: hypothetical protein CME70_12975 [Halobacteriovorax sp.]|nr:hypothetical protein [Halobacteriovorax sp.]|tara:strand:+ start:141440 stop:142348 length:909 start_codon:yes stop_codon:yes gene_type:complete